MFSANLGQQRASKTTGGYIPGCQQLQDAVEQLRWEVVEREMT